MMRWVQKAENKNKDPSNAGQLEVKVKVLESESVEKNGKQNRVDLKFMEMMESVQHLDDFRNWFDRTGGGLR